MAGCCKHAQHELILAFLKVVHEAVPGPPGRHGAPPGLKEGQMTAPTPVLRISAEEAVVPSSPRFWPSSGRTLAGGQRPPGGACPVSLRRVFSRCFRCLTASAGRVVESWIWRTTSMVRGLISELSYPWAVEPAGSTARSGLYFRVKAQAARLCCSGGRAFWLQGPLPYFISTIFRTERKSPARNPYRYTPVATLAPAASRPSHSNS